MSAAAVATAVIQGLPWVVFGILLVEFALADELPAPRVRRMVVLPGIILMTVSAAATTMVSVRTVAVVIGIAVGPLAFLAAHAVLREGFLRIKGSEPVLMFGPGAHRTKRSFHEPAVPRRVSLWDYVYSMFVGAAMLLSAAPAMAEIIRRSA